MSDTSTNKFVGYGTAAERGAFTPSPASIAAAPKQLFLWLESDTISLYGYDTSWHQLTSGGAGSYIKLSQIVTAASQATVDFTSISGSYSSLKVLWIAKDTTAGNGVSTMYLKVNNDGTSGNYTSAYFSGSSNGTANNGSDAATSSGIPAGNNTNAGTTSEIGMGELTIVGYAQTTFFKPIRSQWSNFSTTNNGQVFNQFGTWKSTAAITRLTFTAGTAFTDGSIFTLYGLA